MKWTLGALLPLVAVACATPQGGGVPSYPDALPVEAPVLTDLEEGTLAQGTDGFLYSAGIDGEPGAAFVIRYGGDWPQGAGDRPALGLARVARRFPSGKVLLQAEYLLPGPNLTGSRLEAWTSPAPPRVGKGLARVGGVSSTEVALEIGAEHGVGAGDQYLIVRPARGGERLGHRVVASVRVTATTKSGSTGRFTARSAKVTEGQWALFVGPGREGRAPLLIEVAAFEGAASNAPRDAVVKALEARVADDGIEGVTVAAVDARFDGLDPHFNGPSIALEPTAGHRMLVAGRVDDGKLMLNYTNTGISVAHAMIAATPERGFAVGAVGALDTDGLLGLWINLSAAAETHRGENAAAIVTLEQRLREPGWTGPARWHARDQLAMRWAQSGYTRQALWTVQQDVALAESESDSDAIVNAVGTLMPLFEELGLADASLLAAERFYTVRKSLGESVYTMHAWKAFIDSLAAAGRHEEAATELAAFEDACAPVLDELRGFADAGEPAAWGAASCAGDLFFAFLGNVWRTEGDARDGWLGRAEELAGLLDRKQVAGLRVAQGLAALYREDHDGAHIAFLEALRLYRQEQSLPGVARVEALRFNLYLAQDMRQEAFESAMAAAEMYAEMGDVHELISVYRTLPWLYANIPIGQAPIAPYMGQARPTMREALKYQLASGRPERVAEVFLATGRFVMTSAPGDAEALLQRAREFALQSTDFGIAARATFLLAVLARGRGDGAGFRSTLDDARELARISGDPNLLQQIMELEEGGNPDRPTL